MNLQFEDIETIFTHQLRGILTKTEAEIAEVKERVKIMGKELKMLDKEPSEEDMVMVDMAAHFLIMANQIKYAVEAELNNRKFELN